MCLFWSFSLLFWFLGFHIGAKRNATLVVTFCNLFVFFLEEQKSDVVFQVTRLSPNLHNRSTNSIQHV